MEGDDTLNKILTDDRYAVSGPRTDRKDSSQNVDFAALLSRNRSLEAVKMEDKPVTKA